MKPLWVEFPTDIAVFGIDDQHTVGSALLVRPVTDSGVDQVTVYLPGLDQVCSCLYMKLFYVVVKCSDSILIFCESHQL